MRAKGRRPMDRRQTALRQPTSMNQICCVAAYLNPALQPTPWNRRRLSKSSRPARADLVSFSVRFEVNHDVGVNDSSGSPTGLRSTTSSSTSRAIGWCTTGCMT